MRNSESVFLSLLLSQIMPSGGILLWQLALHRCGYVGEAGLKKSMQNQQSASQGKKKSLKKSVFYLLYYCFSRGRQSRWYVAGIYRHVHERRTSLTEWSPVISNNCKFLRFAKKLDKKNQYIILLEKVVMGNLNRFSIWHMQKVVEDDSFVRENPKLLHVLPGQAPIASSRSRKPPTYPLNRRQQMERTMWNHKFKFPDVLGVIYGNRITDLTLH